VTGYDFPRPIVVVAGVPPAFWREQPTRLPPQKNGEGGKKVEEAESGELRVERSEKGFSESLNSQPKTLNCFKKPEARIFARLHLIRAEPAAAIVDRGPSAGGGSEKLLREKEE
jgi:hypothetical protein